MKCNRTACTNEASDLVHIDGRKGKYCTKCAHKINSYNKECGGENLIITPKEYDEYLRRKYGYKD